ncbi:MAG: DUF1730 domain-containing protein [Ruminococcaceae bacterium]|nr:DUF1730 domain-containing protein [Oscillospiraceae bacterium]
MDNTFVIETAKKIGIEKIGFCSAKKFKSEYKSVIAALFCYYSGDEEGANLSKYCYGLDYHKVVKNILEKLAKKLNLKEYEIFCDTGKNNDRLIAYESGLGFFGLNSLLICDEYGSFFFIGYIFCNENFEYSNPDTRECKKCGECIKKCPANAILGDFKIDVPKCLSEITQKKGEHTEDEKNLIIQNNTVFGCDICQNVCPHNQNIEKTKFKEFSQNLVSKLDYDEIFSMSNKEFMNKYGNRAFSWRGKKVLERNLLYINEK